MAKVKVRHLDAVSAPVPRHYNQTKVKTCGNVIECTIRTKDGSGADGVPARKLNADEYLNLITGEVGQYEHKDNRAEIQRSFFRTLERIRDLINTNVTIAENALFMTLTYAENMTDTEKLRKDFKSFWLRFGRWCDSSGIDKPEYIMVIEPQGRGAWHAHLILIWQHKAPFLDNNEVIERLWKHGFTKTQAIHGVDNVGAYFGAYLADVPLDEFDGVPDSREVIEKEFRDMDGKKVKKKFVKGARARLYPAGMDIVRHSRGLKEPTIEEMTWQQAKEKVSGATETFKKAFTVEFESGEEIQTFIKRYYNRQRKPAQPTNDSPIIRSE